MGPQSPNPTSIVLWETSSSLEHSCWACATKSNSPKALHTCYGIHSMPCLAYHPTMHAVGAAHRCSACISGREIHEGRHRVIAQLLVDFRATEELNESQEPVDRSLQERPVNIRGRDGQEVVEQWVEEHNESDEENVSLVDTCSTVTSGDDMRAFKPTKAEMRQKKRAIKAQKSQNKAAKNQARNLVQVTSADVAKVNSILHGNQADGRFSTHPLATDTTIEDVIARNNGFVRQVQCHIRELKEQVAQGRREESARKQHKRRISDGLLADMESEMAISAILIKLGINTNLFAATTSPLQSFKVPSNSCRRGRLKGVTKTNFETHIGDNSSSRTNHKPTKEQVMIVNKLRAAIKDDLEKHENELKQTYIRAGAFFRYAGRQVFERMTEIASRIDVQTGEAWEKKLKRERENDDRNNDRDVADMEQEGPQLEEGALEA